MLLPGDIAPFDIAVDQRKKELRVERWSQILNIKRKPNKIQARILRENFKALLIAAVVIAVLIQHFLA